VWGGGKVWWVVFHLKKMGRGWVYRDYCGKGGGGGNLQEQNLCTSTCDGEVGQKKAVTGGHGGAAKQK